MIIIIVLPAKKIIGALGKSGLRPSSLTFTSGGIRWAGNGAASSSSGAGAAEGSGDLDPVGVVFVGVVFPLRPERTLFGFGSLGGAERDASDQ